MMLSADVKRKLMEGVREFSRAFDPRRWQQEAERAFSEIRLGGPLEALAPLGFQSGPLLELAARPSPYRRAFGLDGGSTRPIHFANGTTLCANQAVMLGEPPQELEGLPLEASRTVALITHSFSPSGGPKADYREHEGGLLALWRIHLTRDYLWGELDHILKGLADAASEARHGQRLAERLSLGREDLLFLDGNVFPIGLYYLLKERPRSGDLLAFSGAVEALAGHLRLAELMAERGTAYVGVNKTPQTAYLVETLPARGPFADDRQLIRALFLGLPKDRLGWTNWFIQERYPAPGRPGPKDEGSDIFRELAASLKPRLPPEEYHVAYFFVFDPRAAAGQGSVLKVEAPRLVFNHHDPEELQLAVLSEIARGEGVPNVIRRADSRARITQEEREALIRGSGLPLDLGYNQGRGEPW